MRTEPIKLPVKDVRIGKPTDKGWRCDVIFGIPGDWTHDDPTITVTSDDVEKYPRPGDVMLVYPPQVVGYADEEIRDDLQVPGADTVEVFITDGAGCRYSGSTFKSIEAARAWLKLQPNRESLRVAVMAKFILAQR